MKLKIRTCVQILSFDKRGNFRISVFEMTRANCFCASSIKDYG